jgi:hypothetical protein
MDSTTLECRSRPVEISAEHFEGRLASCDGENNRAAHFSMRWSPSKETRIHRYLHKAIVLLEAMHQVILSLVRGSEEVGEGEDGAGERV